MKTLYAAFVQFILPLVDLILLLASGLAAYGLYHLLGLGQQALYPLEDVIRTVAMVGLGTLLIFIILGVYDRDSGLLNVEEIQKTAKGLCWSFLGSALVLVLINVQIPRYVFVLFYLIATLVLVCEKLLLYHLLPLSRAIPGMTRRVIIYGAGEAGQTLFHAMVSSPKLGLLPVGFVDDRPGMQHHGFTSRGLTGKGMHIRVLGHGSQLAELARIHRVTRVVLTHTCPRELHPVLQQLRQNGVKLSMIPSLPGLSEKQLTLTRLGAIPLVGEGPPERQRFYPLAKPWLDRLAALVLLLFTLPLFAWIALAIKRDSPGPVFFTHQRIGKNGTPFPMIKFRTMVHGTPAYAVNPQSAQDPRITQIGRFLRRTSLDELPQLINVLKGEMSLVGPRPEMPFIVDGYTDRHRRRLDIKPGITGLWQLSGDRKQAIHENMEYDLYYIQHHCFFLDVAILMETAVFAFRGI